MTKLFVALSVLLMTQVTQAAKNADPKDLVADFLGKTGTYSFASDAGPCSVTIEHFEDEQMGIPPYDYILIDAPHAYFTKHGFDLVDFKLKSEKKGVYTFENKEKDGRMGGDSCGDWGGSTGYKKQLIIDQTKKSVTVFESFRCIYEGLKKYELAYVCQF